MASQDSTVRTASDVERGRALISGGRFPLSLDMLLLLVLTMAHLYFNPASSALVVSALAVYVALGWFFPAMGDETGAASRRDRWLFLIRLSIVLFVVFIAALAPLGLNIIQRRADGPATHAHDGLIQTEAAIQFLLEGKNPYTENYLNTPMADFKGGEPPFTSAPLYHNAYLPFLFIGSIPLYVLSRNLIGWYDQRFLYLLMFSGLILLLPTLVMRQRDKLILVASVGLNFLFIYFLADGRNDIAILFWLVLVTFLLTRGWVSASAFALGLALATKHSAWFFLPFYYAYLLPRPWTLKGLRRVLMQTLPLFVIVAAIFIPFLMWDASSFVDDTISYVIGTSATSFPIKGWGISTLLLTFGIIPSAESSFPFGVLEALFGLPALALLLRWQLRENTLQRAWFGFAIFSFVVEYFSRFFNDNYFVFVLEAFIIAAFITMPDRRVSGAGPTVVVAD